MRYEVVFHSDNTATIYFCSGRADQHNLPIIREKTMHYLTALKWMTRQGIRWQWRENPITGESAAWGAEGA